MRRDGDRAEGAEGADTVRPERTLALWCPDWAFVAAGLDPTTEAAVVLRAGRVAACSHAARTEGVVRGMRKREAQSRAPALVVLDDDPALAARTFEPVVDALAALVPSVEVVRPGLAAVAVRRAARWFGGESRLATRLVAEVHDRTASGTDGSNGDEGVHVETGIADGLFAALLAAREGAVVPPGATPEFLAPRSVGLLDRPDLANLLTRLGITTLGALAALPAGEVLNRFGEEGAWAHRIAGGTERRVRRAHVAAVELAVRVVLDPPVLRVDMAAFAARALAEELHAGLRAHGLAALRVSVEAETEAGETLSRAWRHDGTLSAAALADRARWQLDGWLSGTITSADGKPTAGITVLRLVPDQLVPAAGRQLGLAVDGHAYVDPERDERVDRALTRVQGLLGHESVVTAVLVGGRDPDEQVRLVPWTDPRDASADAAGQDTAPWPGRLPSPAPATVLSERLLVDVRDGYGSPVAVTGRSVVSAAPAQVRTPGRGWVDVVAWAGPWPADTRWWDATTRRRRARFQVVTADGEAWLLTREDESWYLDALYD